MFTLTHIIIAFLYLAGIYMFIFNGNKNLIYILISLELLLIAIAYIFLHSAFLLDDAFGSLVALIILPLAGVESAFGLTILINLYHQRGSLAAT